MHRAVSSAVLVVLLIAGGAGWALAGPPAPVVDLTAACAGEGGITLTVTSDTDLAPGRLVFRGAQFIGGTSDEPVNGTDPVQAGVAYPVSTSRHGESFLLLDGDVVIGQGTDTDVPPCEPGLPVERIFGADRYETAAALALRFYQGARFVYLASGESFPDALAGAGIPDQEQGPVLLTGRDSLPQATRDALAALGPQHLRVLGGPAAVSDAVLAQAQAAAGL